MNRTHRMCNLLKRNHRAGVRHTSKRIGEVLANARQRTLQEAPDRRSLTPVDLQEVGEEPQLDSVWLKEVAIKDDRLANGQIERSLLEGVTLVGANAGALIVRATRFERCDLSASSLEAASFGASTFDGCRLTGARLDRAVLKDVLFSECRGDLLQLQHAKLQRVRFERCQLRGAFFNGASMPKSVFDACDLSEADFSQANLAGSDLRRSRIEGIRIGPDQLSGVIVTHDQALYLAGLLGLVIRDE